ncbi:MAG: PIN domain-containing protein [Bacteroidetes bacterium]|nr:PIN domain-containing protein [Bacteroidota bacterium]
MNKAFIDTDVILDFLIAREPFAVDAARIFSLSENKQISICTSGLVFSNSYYVLRKLGTHKKVIEKLTQLTRLIDVIGLSKTAVMQALGSDFSDFEDALQHYAALAEGVKVIVTRNTKDYKHSQLAVLTPDQYLKARS